MDRRALEEANVENSLPHAASVFNLHIVQVVQRLKLASFNHSHPNSAEYRGVGVSPGNGLLLVVPADPTRHT